MYFVLCTLYFVLCTLYFGLCTFVPLYLCTFVPVYLCTFVPLYLCTFVPLYLCTLVPVYLCTCVPVSLCPFVPLSLCTLYFVLCTSPCTFPCPCPCPCPCLTVSVSCAVSVTVSFVARVGEVECTLALSLMRHKEHGFTRELVMDIMAFVAACHHSAPVHPRRLPAKTLSPLIVNILLTATTATSLTDGPPQEKHEKQDPSHQKKKTKLHRTLETTVRMPAHPLPSLPTTHYNCAQWHRVLPRKPTAFGFQRKGQKNNQRLWTKTPLTSYSQSARRNCSSSGLTSCEHPYLANKQARVKDTDRNP